MRNLKNLFGITLLGLVSCAYNDEALTPEDSYPQAMQLGTIQKPEKQ